jgi:hypothetical protein
MLALAAVQRLRQPAVPEGLAPVARPQAVSNRPAVRRPYWRRFVRRPNELVMSLPCAVPALALPEAAQPRRRRLATPGGWAPVAQRPAGSSPAAVRRPGWRRFALARRTASVPAATFRTSAAMPPARLWRLVRSGAWRPSGQQRAASNPAAARRPGWDRSVPAQGAAMAVTRPRAVPVQARAQGPARSAEELRRPSSPVAPGGMPARPVRQQAASNPEAAGKPCPDPCAPSRAAAAQARALELAAEGRRPSSPEALDGARVRPGRRPAASNLTAAETPCSDPCVPVPEAAAQLPA